MHELKNNIVPSLTATTITLKKDKVKLIVDSNRDRFFMKNNYKNKSYVRLVDVLRLSFTKVLFQNQVTAVPQFFCVF